MEERYFLRGMALTVLIVAFLIVDIVLGFAFSDQIIAAWNDLTYRISEAMAWLDQDLERIEKGLGI
jgi:regulatory protein YycI of two-component signal transduction system YycFG